MLRYRFLTGLALAWWALPALAQSPSPAQSPSEQVPPLPDTPVATPVSEVDPPRPPLDMSNIGGGMMGMGGSMLPGGTYRTTWLPSQSISG